MELEYTDHKDSDLKLVSISGDAFEILEDNQLLVQNMMASRKQDITRIRRTWTGSSRCGFPRNEHTSTAEALFQRDPGGRTACFTRARMPSSRCRDTALVSQP